MDLSTLPNELLVRILVYSKSANRMKLRKLSSRIDELAVRNNLKTRIPVRHLVIDNDGKTFIIHISIEKLRSYGFCTEKTAFYKFHENEPSMEEVEEIFSRIEVYSIRSTFCRYIFEDAFMDIVKRNKICFSKLESLILEKAPNVTCTKEHMKAFMDSCPELRRFQFRGFKDLNAICNSEVLGGRKWEVIRLYPQHNLREVTVIDSINKEFLFAVVKNCHKFIITTLERMKISISVEDMLDFVKVCKREKIFAPNQHWLFDKISYGSMTDVDIKNRLDAIHVNSLLLQRRVKPGEHDIGPIHDCRIYFKPMVQIVFRICDGY